MKRFLLLSLFILTNLLAKADCFPTFTGFCPTLNTSGIFTNKKIVKAIFMSEESYPSLSNRYYYRFIILDTLLNGTGLVISDTLNVGQELESIYANTANYFNTGDTVILAIDEATVMINYVLDSNTRQEVDSIAQHTLQNCAYYDMIVKGNTAVGRYDDDHDPNNMLGPGINVGVDTLPLSEVLSLAKDGIGPCGNVTSNPNLDYDNGFFIFPNPTNTMININSNTAIETFFIRSIDGAVVKEYTGNSSSIDLGDFPKGVYILTTILEDNRTLSKRIVKN